MTRFTRARGSKASNERLPDKSTPWHVMKQQLEQSIEVKKSLEKQSASKSANTLLQEIEDKLYYGEPGCVNREWAEFQSDNNREKNYNKRINKSSSGNVQVTPTKLVKLNESKPLDEASTTQNNLFLENHKSIDKSKFKFSKRQKRNRKNKIKSLDCQNKPQLSDKFETNPGMFNTEGNQWNYHVKFGYKNKSIEYNDEKNEFNHTHQPVDNSQNQNVTNIQKHHDFNNPSERLNKQKIVKKRKPPKVRDDKEHKRKKANPGPKKVMINGMQVEIVMYDGFPLKKEDANRLNELRQQMVMKGIPKFEIDSAMKLERRKAEKALARIRKNVCFHCRKAGHNLSDCPDLGKEEAIMGICFKCGSTEHTHFQCKVIKKQEFGYAKCFICREQGHIAKQCPDNPKGLYPNGGACKICGDVTHFKKDCPDFIKEKEESTLTLDTIADNIVESLETEKQKDKIKELKNKIIKF